MSTEGIIAALAAVIGYTTGDIYMAVIAASCGAFLNGKHNGMNLRFIATIFIGLLLALSVIAPFSHIVASKIGVDDRYLFIIMAFLASLLQDNLLNLSNVMLQKFTKTDLNSKKENE